MYLKSLSLIILVFVGSASLLESAPRHTKSKRITRNTMQQHQQPDEDDEELRIVLSNFACVVNHFVNIVKDPHNTQNVAQGIGGILCNIGNVIAQAIKSHKISELDVIEYEEEISRCVKMLTQISSFK